MLTKCPSCESLFDLPESALSAKKFRCSTCGHVFENEHIHQPHHLMAAESKWTIDWWILVLALGFLVFVTMAEFPLVKDYFKSWYDYVYMQNVDPQRVLNVYEAPLQIHPGVVSEPSQTIDLSDTGDHRDTEDKDNPAKVD